MSRLRDRACAAGKDLTRAVYRGWFAMTASEQRAMLLVVSLFLLGLAVKWWRGR